VRHDLPIRLIESIFPPQGVHSPAPFSIAICSPLAGSTPMHAEVMSSDICKQLAKSLNLSDLTNPYPPSHSHKDESKD
jgi:hypothetical protein